MLLFKKIWVYPLLFFLFTGCRKPTSANWDVDLVVPVVNSSLNIRNFISDTIFKTDNSGLLSLSLDREVVSLKLDSLLVLPDTTLPPIPLNYQISTQVQPGFTYPFPPSEISFDVGGGAKLKRADVREGSITVTFSNNVGQPIDLQYCINDAFKNNLPFQIKETIPPGNGTLVKTYDLSGYSLRLGGISGYKYNTVAQSYTLGLNANASPVYWQASTGATISITYSKIVPDYVEGDFGQQVVKITADTTRIDLAKDITATNFMLSDATFDFSIYNEFGAEFSANLSNLKSINSRQSNTVTLNAPLFTAIHVDAATKAGNVLSPRTKTISLNASNSNVTAFISNLPNLLAYSGSATLNPRGDQSGYNNFAFYNTGISIHANVNIPLRFTANSFQLRSKTPVNFSTISQLDKVNSGSFVISAANGYPFDAKMQAYLLDANGTVLDSLFAGTANVIQHGQLDNQNKVIAPTQSQLRVPVNKIKIDNLRKTKFVQVVPLFIMPPNPPEIRLYENYQFNVNIIAELNYNVGLGSN